MSVFGESYQRLIASSSVKFTGDSADEESESKAIDQIDSP